MRTRAVLIAVLVFGTVSVGLARLIFTLTSVFIADLAVVTAAFATAGHTFAQTSALGNVAIGAFVSTPIVIDTELRTHVWRCATRAALAAFSAGAR